jgi:hypothetical protein
MSSGSKSGAIKNIFFWIFIHLCDEIKGTMLRAGISLINCSEVWGADEKGREAC